MRALAFSGGKDSMACLHLMRDSLDFGLYVDTGFSYPETQAMVRYANDILPIHVVKTDRAVQNDVFGIPSEIVPADWTYFGQLMTGEKPSRIQSYLDCCGVNVCLPLMSEAKKRGVTEIVFGQRKSESHKAPVGDGAMAGTIKRIHPIEDWTDDEVFQYLATKMTVPAHYAIKHSSLDCYDCTAYRTDSADRVAWTKREHPVFFAAYEARNNKLTAALAEARQHHGL